MAHTVTRALVTGAAGFVGRHLVRALLDDGVAVTALSLGGAPDNLEDNDPLRAANWLAGDVCDAARVAVAVDEARPDLVIPLAAISHLPTAAADPAGAWQVNVGATVTLLDILAKAHAAGVLAPRILVIGSAEQYGKHPDAAMPLEETAPLYPRTVYAATKVAQEVAALQQWRATELPVIAVRPFNHSGAGQESRFLLPALVGRALALRAHTGDRELALGNTTPVRDFLHVSDVVAAYIALGRRGIPGEAYNVASGEGHSVRTVAERILARVGAAARLTEDPALVRPVDVPSLVGNPLRVQTATGWRPRFTFDDLLDDLINAATH